MGCVRRQRSKYGREKSENGFLAFGGDWMNAMQIRRPTLMLVKLPNMSGPTKPPSENFLWHLKNALRNANLFLTLKVDRNKPSKMKTHLFPFARNNFPISTFLFSGWERPWLPFVSPGHKPGKKRHLNVTAIGQKGKGNGRPWIKCSRVPFHLLLLLLLPVEKATINGQKRKREREGISQYNGIVSSKESGQEGFFLEWPELLWQSFATLEGFFAWDTVAKSHL